MNTALFTDWRGRRVEIVATIEGVGPQTYTIPVFIWQNNRAEALRAIETHIIRNYDTADENGWRWVPDFEINQGESEN